MAQEHRPRMITVGASAYPRIIDFKRMGEIAREVGAYLLADIAHIAGLVAVGLHPSPMEHADFVTTTTTRLLRGPRGGLILCRRNSPRRLIPRCSRAFREGLSCTSLPPRRFVSRRPCSPPSAFIRPRSPANAQALAAGMIRNHFRLVSGGTDNHLMLVTLAPKA